MAVRGSGGLFIREAPEGRWEILLNAHDLLIREATWRNPSRTDGKPEIQVNVAETRIGTDGAGHVQKATVTWPGITLDGLAIRDKSYVIEFDARPVARREEFAKEMASVITPPFTKLPRPISFEDDTVSPPVVDWNWEVKDVTANQ